MEKKKQLENVGLDISLNSLLGLYKSIFFVFSLSRGGNSKGLVPSG